MFSIGSSGTFAAFANPTYIVNSSPGLIAISPDGSYFYVPKSKQRRNALRAAELARMEADRKKSANTKAV